ncbi:hypothetical protein NE463_21100, partial [Anaerotruncus colihominis]|nr:hypothetical protein [Anaerotruncus colihominis]
AALTAAGAFSLEDGLKMIAARGAAMQRAADRNPGSMFAIMGSDEETIARVCRETAGYVLPVNYNNAISVSRPSRSVTRRLIPCWKGRLPLPSART